MTHEDQEKLDIFQALRDRAMKGEHTSFEYIKNIAEYFAAKQIDNALSSILSSFKKSYNRILKQYCKEVRTNKADLSLLLIMNELTQLHKFYSAERDIIQDMIDEYRTYLDQGHLLSALFGEQREVWDLWDHRRTFQ
jgi:uncharacterized protein YeeX (DUF496 family)